jgi:hypothetical protein
MNTAEIREYFEMVRQQTANACDVQPSAVAIVFDPDDAFENDPEPWVVSIAVKAHPARKNSRWTKVRGTGESPMAASTAVRAEYRRHCGE